jgi:hypothetical protein
MIACISTFAGNLFLPVLLKCEHLTTPLGVDEQRLGLNWQMDSRSRHHFQDEYRIKIYNNGKIIKSGQPHHVTSGNYQFIINITGYVISRLLNN